MSAGFYRTENEASQETKVHQRRDEAERFLLLAAPATRTDFSLSRELEGNEGSYGPWRSRQHRTKEATGREAPGPGVHGRRSLVAKHSAAEMFKLSHGC